MTQYVLLYTVCIKVHTIKFTLFCRGTIFVVNLRCFESKIFRPQNVWVSKSWQILGMSSTVGISNVQGSNELFNVQLYIIQGTIVFKVQLFKVQLSIIQGTIVFNVHLFNVQLYNVQLCSIVFKVQSRLLPPAGNKQPTSHCYSEVKYISQVA